jgi:hypothetical protein
VIHQQSTANIKQLTPDNQEPTATNVSDTRQSTVSKQSPDKQNKYQTKDKGKQKICHRCQRHRWQIMGTILDCRHLKVNLKEKIYLYVNSSTQRCSKKIIKIFLIEDFFHLPPVSTTPVVHLELQISPRILEKFETALIAYSGA